jgi:hypothetical protein
MNAPLLQVKNLVKHFPIKGGLLQREVGRVHAVDGLSFDLHEKRGISQASHLEIGGGGQMPLQGFIAQATPIADAPGLSDIDRQLDNIAEPHVRIGKNSRKVGKGLAHLAFKSCNGRPVGRDTDLARRHDAPAAKVMDDALAVARARLGSGRRIDLANHGEDLEESWA